MIIKLAIILTVECNTLQIVNTQYMVAKRDRDRDIERQRENNLILVPRQLFEQTLFKRSGLF